MKTISEIIDLSSAFLTGNDRAKRDAEDIIAHVLSFNRTDLYMNFDKPLAESELESIRAYLKKRKAGVPLDYVLGEKTFYKVKLKLNSHTLIPRPETEILVDMIVEKLKGEKKKELWDIGTGSGAIGLAVKKALPDLKVVLSDISEDALQVARENAKNNGLDIEFVHGNLLEPFKGRKADFIVSNPPYISEEAYSELDVSVKNYEPKGALVAGERGTEIYEYFEKELSKFLNPDSKVFFEIGFDQEKSLQNIFTSPFWTFKKIVSDWAGHPRFFFLETE